MFRETELGETQYCPMCEEWAEKYERLQAENEELKHKNEILLGQLVINDGEDVTVQISQSQFDEYNELKVENEELGKIIQCKTGTIYVLKSENERLKEEITTLECKLDAEQPSMIIPKPKQLAVPIEEVETYRKALEEIQKMFSEPCIEGENCFTCNSNCSNKDVLNITTEVLK